MGFVMGFIYGSSWSFMGHGRIRIRRKLWLISASCWNYAYPRCRRIRSLRSLAQLGQGHDFIRSDKGKGFTLNPSQPVLKIYFWPHLRSVRLDYRPLRRFRNRDPSVRRSVADDASRYPRTAGSLATLAPIIYLLVKMWLYFNIALHLSPTRRLGRASFLF